MRFWLSAVLIFILLTGFTISQVPDSSFFGAFFSYNFNYHKSDFRALPGIPNCCPRFTEGRADGFSAGLFYEYALPLNLSISLRGGFNNLAAVFNVYEPTKVKSDNQVADGEFKHYLNIKLSDISINPILNFRLFGGLSLHFGGHGGIFVQNEFDQYEEITKPETRGVFVDTDTRRRNQVSGKIDSLETVFGGLLAGISYRLPLNKAGSLLLVPEIFYLFGQTDMIKNYNWTANSLKMGISLKYTDVTIKKPILEKSIFRPDTIILDTYLPEKAGFHVGQTTKSFSTEETDVEIINTRIISRTDTIFVLKIQKDIINQKPKPELIIVTDKEIVNIRQDYATFYCSVLPSIFFELNSSALPSYYKQVSNSTEYKQDFDPDDPLTIQKDILNVLGSRMKNNPEIKISLKGYIDKTTEGRNCDLAVDRALSIRNYLVSTWGIAKDRIYIVKNRNNCYPVNMTSSQSEMGFADNRRVEILTNQMQVYEPVSIKTPVDLSSPNEGKIIISPKYNYSDSIAEWKISVRNGNKILFQDAGEILPEEITLDIKKYSLKFDLSYDKPLEIELYVKERNNTITYSNKSIPIKVETADIETKRIAYILFDVDKMILNSINESTLKTILNNIGSFRNLKITGYTDVLGDYERNKNLSQSRAETIGKIIKRIKPEGLIIEIKGAATDSYPFGVRSYNTQMERFLSRSVVVELY